MLQWQLSKTLHTKLLEYCILLCFTVKSAFAARAFSLLYQGHFPAISGTLPCHIRYTSLLYQGHFPVTSVKKCVPLYAGEFYPLYMVTHSNSTDIEGNLPVLTEVLFFNFLCDVRPNVYRQFNIVKDILLCLHDH